MIDYAFTQKYWNELLDNIKNLGASIKTIYLKTTNLKEHEKVWKSRSRDFSIRHVAHGATTYHDGVGRNYVNKYCSKVFETMPTFGETLEIEVSFTPYSKSKSNNDILGFVIDQE